MIITKYGESTMMKGYAFACDNCGCEWIAHRNEVSISPPCFEYFIYMKCPWCGRDEVKGKDNRGR